MPRPEKVQAVEEIRDRFAEASATFMTEYRGLTVVQQQKLRNSLRAAGASYKVFKMTLARRAIDELGHGELTEFLYGPTAIAFASDDPAPVAKVLYDFGKEHEALVIKAGFLDGVILTPEIVAKLAKIDSRDVLLAKLAGAMKGPLTKMAGMLGSMTRDAASVFSQLLERKQAEAPSESAPEASAPEETAADAAAEPAESSAEEADAGAASDAKDVEEPAAEGEPETAADAADVEDPAAEGEPETAADAADEESS